MPVGKRPAGSRPHSRLGSKGQRGVTGEGSKWEAWWGDEPPRAAGERKRTARKGEAFLPSGPYNKQAHGWVNRRSASQRDGHSTLK